MEKFLSSYGYPDNAVATMDKHEGLKELVHEFCTAFDVKVTHNNDSDSVNRRFVNVVDNNGYPLGSLKVDKNRDGNKIYIYDCETIVNKSKSSANSYQGARDSTKISGLIKSLKTNGEYPRATGTYKHLMQVINYGFGAMGKERMSRNISIPAETFMGMACQILNRPSEFFTMDKDLIQRHIDQYYKEKAESKESDDLIQRFSKGIFVIRLASGGFRLNMDGFYAIGKATYDPINNKATITEPFVRYDSILDSPFSGLALMSKTYMSNKSNYSSDNEFGIGRGDSYIADLDVVNCYGNSLHLLLVPDNAD